MGHEVFESFFVWLGKQGESFAESFQLLVWICEFWQTEKEDVISMKRFLNGPLGSRLRGPKGKMLPDESLYLKSI